MERTKYIDYLMQNRSYNDKNQKQKGGRIPKDVVDRPTGGFPPIFICEKKKDDVKQDDSKSNKKRDYSTKSLANIQTILNQRRIGVKTQQFVQL